MQLKFSRDINGNKLLSVKTFNRRAFSVQTMANIPSAHRATSDDLESNQALRAQVISELCDYIALAGTKLQQDSLLLRYRAGHSAL